MTPRFVPFEAMTDAEQVEHLQRVHMCPADERSHREDAVRFACHKDWERFRFRPIAPHTHDKPTRRTA